MRLLIIGLLILSCSGCATYYARQKDETSLKFVFMKSGIYPATRLDMDFISAKELVPTVPAILDLPFSLTFDTLLLPYDIYVNSINICNNKTYEDEIKEFIMSNNSNPKINKVIITQMHMKDKFILVEYKFNCCSDETVSLVKRESAGSFRIMGTISHGNDGGSKEVITNYLKIHLYKDLHNMVDCYYSGN